MLRHDWMKCVCYDRYEKNMCENFKSSSSIFDFTVKDLQDKNLELSKYDNGKVLLIVNFATNDELADRNFLELKDLKLKFSDGDKDWRCKHFNRINVNFLCSYLDLALPMLSIWRSDGRERKLRDLLLVQVWRYWVCRRFLYGRFSRRSFFIVINILFFRLMSMDIMPTQSIDIWHNKSRQLSNGISLSSWSTSEVSQSSDSIIKLHLMRLKKQWKFYCRHENFKVCLPRVGGSSSIMQIKSWFSVNSYFSDPDLIFLEALY